MKTFSIIPISLLAFILFSCSGDNKPGMPVPMINEDTMLDILTDLHQTEGLMKIPTIRNRFADKDSVEVYMEVIEQYGFSKSEFDMCLDYYFLAKPKKLNIIYEKVLERFSAMEDENLQNSGSQNPQNKNLWTLKPSYRMPNDGTSNPIEFSIALEGTGLYTIRIRAIIHTDDQSENLATNIFFWYDDGSEDGKIEAWDKHVYELTGKSAVLTFEKRLSNPEFTHLKGKLLDHTLRSGHWEMHSSISGINVSFEADKLDDPEPVKE